MSDNTVNNKNFNLPNKLTAFRLLCIPLVIFFLSFQGRWLSFFAAFFIGMAFITDNDDRKLVMGRIITEHLWKMQVTNEDFLLGKFERSYIVSRVPFLKVCAST